MSKGTVTLQVEEYERLRDIERSINDKPCVIIENYSFGRSYRGYNIDELNQELLKDTEELKGEFRKKIEELKNELRKAESDIFDLKRENRHLTLTLESVKLENDKFGKMSVWQLLGYWFNR